MNIEYEIFKRSRIDFSKLSAYGFKKEKEDYVFSKKINNDLFLVEIRIDKERQIKGNIYDLAFQEEYTNFRREGSGGFALFIREQFENILNDIKNKCTTQNDFLFSQTNRVASFIQEKYQVLPEFLWKKSPNHAVFREKESEKWFGIIMNIEKSKLLPKEKGKIEVLNVKLDEEVSNYLKRKGIYPAYHMSKKNWVSIILDDTLTDEEIETLIVKSYASLKQPNFWIVPANPKFYDVVHAFQKSNTLLWKQSSSIQVDDIVYIYVAAPYSCLFYRCRATSVNIPYDYQDKNLKIKKAMKLELLKKYEEREYSFSSLQKLGIKAIRGPIKIKKEISDLLV